MDGSSYWFTKLSVAVVGDIHSRAARSQLHALTTFGLPDIRVVRPKTLLLTAAAQMMPKAPLSVHHDLASGLRGDDVVVMMLRLQNERMQGALLPSPQEYCRSCGLTREKLAPAKPDVIFMHPWPMNRGIEIDSAVADDKQAMILPHVAFGIVMRMAVMSMLAGGGAAQ